METKVKKTKRKGSIFPCFLLAYVLVLLIGIGYVCNLVWEGLEAYQARYDKALYLAGDTVYMDNVTGSFDREAVAAALAAYPQHAYVTEQPWSMEQHLDYFAALVEKHGVSYSQNESYKENAPVFDLYCGDSRIAVLSLRHGKEADEFGFRNWETKAIVFDTNPIVYKDYTLETMDTMQVLLDGEPLDHSYCTFSGTVLDVQSQSGTAKYHVAQLALERDGVVPGNSTYLLKHCITLPNLQVLDSLGNAVEPTQQEETRLVFAEDAASRAFADSIQQRVLDTCNAYIMNIYRKGTFYSVSRYLIGGSQAYKVIKDVQSSIAWGWKPDTVTVLFNEVSDVQQYAENLFACTYRASVHKADEKQEETEDFCYRMLFERKGEEWYLNYFILQAE